MYINPISNYQSNNTTFNGRTIKVDNWTIFKNMFSKVGRQANSYIEKNDLKYILKGFLFGLITTAIILILIIKFL